MALRVLIAPDKFKGTLTAPEAARAIARGWRRARPADYLDSLPISDGGDGFGDVMRRLLLARPRRTTTIDAAHRPGHVCHWYQARNRLAVVETARVIGLAMLPRGRYHPFDLDTFGLGAVLQAVARSGAGTCLVGIGGSATNDGGFGLARAFGWRFLDRSGRSIVRWTDLHNLADLQPPQANPLGGLKVIVATDVQNRLLGRLGATRVYGPQKGIRPKDVPTAEAALERLSRVTARAVGHDFGVLPGAGAAGGLGFGLMAFAGARVERGFALFARAAGLGRRLRRADVVVTGEGALDRSTLMGKGVGELARLCYRLGRPCLGLGGCADNRQALVRRFTAVYALCPDLTARTEAEADAARWLGELARRVASALRERQPRAEYRR